MVGFRPRSRNWNNGGTDQVRGQNRSTERKGVILFQRVGRNKPQRKEKGEGNKIDENLQEPTGREGCHLLRKRKRRGQD